MADNHNRLWLISIVFFNLYLGLDARKTVFGVSDQVRLKPTSSATKTTCRHIEFYLLQVELKNMHKSNHK